MSLADRFGITDAVVKKGVLATGATMPPRRWQHGQAEDRSLADQRDRADQGREMAGPLPGDTQLWTHLWRARSDEQQEPAHARAFHHGTHITRDGAALDAPAVSSK